MRTVRLASEPAIQSPFITAAECAVYLKFADVDSLYRAVTRDGIPHRRRGRTLLFIPAELDRWLAGESRIELAKEARHAAKVTRPVFGGPSNSVGGEQ